MTVLQKKCEKMSTSEDGAASFRSEIVFSQFFQNDYEDTTTQSEQCYNITCAATVKEASILRELCVCEPAGVF